LKAKMVTVALHDALRRLISYANGEDGIDDTER